MNPKCTAIEADVSTLVYAGCNANCNGMIQSFQASLFTRHHCAVCQQTRYSALLHVCDAQRLDPRYDRMCIDCVVQSMCTGKNGRHQTYCPTRHHTPVVTAILGLSVLDEIQKIVVTAYSLSETECDEWTYDLDFEKRINNTQERVDLVITIRRHGDPVWYILGMVRNVGISPVHLAVCKVKLCKCIHMTDSESLARLKSLFFSWAAPVCPV